MLDSRAIGLGLFLHLGLGVPSADAEGQSFQTISSSRQVRGEDRLDVDVEFAIGSFRLYPDDSGALYRGEMVYDGDMFDPEISYDPEYRELHVRVGSFHFGGGIEHHERSKQRLELAVTRVVPVHIDVEFGAGEGDIELGGLTLASANIATGASSSQVRFSDPNRITCSRISFEVGAAEFRAQQLGNARCERIDLAAGAGELTLDFSGDWGSVGRARADIGVGLGSLTLRFPADLGVSVDVSRFLATFDRSGFTRRGGKYYSRNYATASTKLDLDITAALGTIDVVWLDN